MDKFPLFRRFRMLSLWNKLGAISAILTIVALGLSIAFWLYPRPTPLERSNSPIRISSVDQFGVLTDATTDAGCMTGDAYASVHGDVLDAKDLDSKAAILAPTTLTIGIDADVPAPDSVTLLGVEIDARSVDTAATERAQPLQLAFGNTACASGEDLDRSLQYRLVLDPASKHYSFKPGADSEPMVPITLRSSSTLTMALLLDARAAGLYTLETSVRYRYRGKDSQVKGPSVEVYWPERDRQYRYFSYLYAPSFDSPLEEMDEERAESFKGDLVAIFPRGFPPSLASGSVRSERIPP